MLKIDSVNQNNNLFGPATISKLPVIGTGTFILDVVLFIGLICGLVLLVKGILSLIKSRNQKMKNSRMKKALLVMLALGFSMIL